MSWFVLVLTIAIALIIAAAILIRPGEPAGARPTFGTWIGDAKATLQNARQPVSPIDYSDLGARTFRGLKIAGPMVIVGLLFVAQWVNDGGWVLVVVLLAVLPFSAVAGVISVTHTLVLRLLPYRGPIVSTTLGGLLGFAAAYFLRDSMMPKRGLVIAGVVYGAIVGVIDSSIAQEKAAKPEPLTEQAT